MKLIMGIDLGSRDVKIALMNNEEFSFHRFDTIDFYRKYGRRVDDNLRIDFAALNLPQVEKVVSTGYGRLTIKVEGGTVIPEIKAHVLGAVYQTNEDNFTLLDLGGQDSKIVKVVNGKMKDFNTNDKCAASSGRYLENMAKVLGISVQELGEYYQEPVALSSTCAVFGESEVIGKIIEGTPISHIAAGVNQTIVNRVKPLMHQLQSNKIVFTGGVALSPAMKKLIQKELDVEVIVPTQPQFNGAIGCCIHGRNEI